MSNDKKPLVAIVGPTAVGKTALSIDLAKKFNAEIISGDSMQVYRGMDIGTAKITEEEMQGVPHHLIDFLEPDESFNALKFKNLSEALMPDILARNHLPMIVGGTGLYVNGLIYDYGFKGERDESYRNSVFEELRATDSAEAYNRIIEIRPDLKGVLHEKDHFRISRAMEIIKTEGKETLQNYDMKNNYESPYNLCLLGLNMDRAKLYERINMRVDMMIEAGLVEEVEKLLQQGYNREMQSLKAIGYKEIIDYLENDVPFEAAVDLLKKNTRHFAKRQLTWFRRDPNIIWLNVDEMNYDALLQKAADAISEKCFI